MGYEGEERRKIANHCIHESDWGKLTATVENLDRRINGSLHEMEKHMDSGKGWRMSLIGVIVAIFLQIITFAYLWGGLTEQVEANGKRLSNLETIEVEAQKIRITNVTKISDIENRINREHDLKDVKNINSK